MLANDFYEIQEINATNEQNADLLLSLNASHPIFKGHFPDQPVVPGVCLMQIVNEVSQQFLKRELTFVKASMVKFLAVIDPNKHEKVRVKITSKEKEPGLTQIISIIYFEETIFFKFKGIYK